jgi:DHA1 family bicyclomycin/chloramphenicol resistance-like MFS transporter
MTAREAILRKAKGLRAVGSEDFVAGLGLAGVLPGFLLVVASIGLVNPNATALALADHPHQAGSASALVGLLTFLVGAAAAPLAGVGGSHTALPMAVVIALLEAAAMATFAILARTRPAEVVRQRLSA